jgi:DNA-binding transcriptional MerR regulator
MGLQLNIHRVAERTGVSVHTLRAWERRYGVPKPGRQPGNRYRLYDEQDIADVLWMKQQIESGVSPAHASFLLKQQRQAQPIDRAPAEQPIAGARAALQDAFLKSDEATARRALDEMLALFTPEQVALQIIQPIMLEIGERWLRNEMAVWQEHLASNLVRQKLLAVLQAQPSPPLSAPSMLAACAPGEEHELGLLTLALLARRQGWSVAYLGQRTPLADLASAAHKSEPDILAISVSTPLGLATLIPWALADNRPATPLVLGGRLPNQFPSLRTHLPGLYVGEDALTGARGLAAKPSGEVWSPPRRAWNAVQELQAQEPRIAGEIAAQFTSVLPKSQQAMPPQTLEWITFYVLDVLASALAFDVPELVEAQREWLSQAMPPRGVPASLLANYLRILQQVLGKSLAKDQASAFQSLLSRLQD